MGTLRLRPVAVILVAAIVGVLVLVWLGQRRLIYFPDQATPSPPDDVREVVLSTADNLALAAWLVPPTGADRRFAVLVAPGNAGHRGHRISLARELAGAGLTVLLVDYRGYGGNPGRPSESGLALDARAALAYLARIGFGPDRTIYFGESLGGGVVAELATEHPPAGLVLRSPFSDLPAVGAHHYPILPVRLLLRDRFPVADNVARVTAPLVVIYGSADATVPPEQSQAVADRAAGPRTVIVIEGADHNDPALSHGPDIVRAVVGLAEQLEPWND